MSFPMTGRWEKIACGTQRKWNIEDAREQVLHHRVFCFGTA